MVRVGEMCESNQKATNANYTYAHINITPGLSAMAHLLERSEQDEDDPGKMCC